MLMGSIEGCVGANGGCVGPVWGLMRATGGCIGVL